jgi:hypothetical protein
MTSRDAFEDETAGGIEQRHAAPCVGVLDRARAPRLRCEASGRIGAGSERLDDGVCARGPGPDDCADLVRSRRAHSRTTLALRGSAWPRGAADRAGELLLRPSRRLDDRRHRPGFVRDAATGLPWNRLPTDDHPETRARRPREATRRPERGLTSRRTASVHPLGRSRGRRHRVDRGERLDAHSEAEFRLRRQSAHRHRHGVVPRRGSRRRLAAGTPWVHARRSDVSAPAIVRTNATSSASSRSKWPATFLARLRRRPAGTVDRPSSLGVRCRRAPPSRSAVAPHDTHVGLHERLRYTGSGRSSLVRGLLRCPAAQGGEGGRPRSRRLHRRAEPGARRGAGRAAIRVLPAPDRRAPTIAGL